MLFPLFVRVTSYANCLAYSTGSMYPTTMCALMQGQEQIWPGGNVSSRPGMVLRFFHRMTPSSIYIPMHLAGAFVEGLGWFRGQWPEDWVNVDISVKELVPAAALWGRHWTSEHVCFHSDNMAVVSILASRTAKKKKKKTLLMHLLLRCFSFFCAHSRFHYSANASFAEL